MLVEELIDNAKSQGFIGRKEILDSIFKKIADKKPAVVVKGAAGSGKTALLGRVIAQLRKKQFSFIVIEGRTHPELLLKMIYEKARKKEIKEAEEIYAGGGLEMRKQIPWVVENFLEKEKIMIAFEDFETNLNLDGKFRNERLKEFLMYLRDKLKDKETFLFFTSEKDIPGFESEPLGEFDDEEFKKLLSLLPTLNRLGEKSREKFFFDMGGNPRALQLLNHIAENESGDKNFDWETLKKWVPHLAQRILYKDSREADFSPLLLEEIMTYLDDRQLAALKCLSLFEGPIKKDALAALQVKISSKDRKRLVDLNLISYFEKGETYRIHSLTARFFQGNMTEKEKRIVHLLSARYYEKIERSQAELDIENKMKARAHYLAAEEWNRAADLTFDLDCYLEPRGYVPLSFDLLKEIENLDYSRENRFSLHKRLLVLSSLFGMYDEVISQGEKLIKMYEDDGDRKNAAQTLSHIAIAFDKKRKYDEALAKYERARQLLEEINNPWSAAYVSIEMGKLQQKRLKYDEALAFYEKALAQAKELNDTRCIAECRHNLGRLCEEKGEIDAAFEHYRQARELREKSLDERGLAATLHQMGNIYFIKGDLETAFDHYRQSLSLAEKQQDLQGQGNSLGQIGMIHQRQGRLDDALNSYKQSLAVFEKLGDRRGISSARHQIGRTYQEQGKLDEALEQYKKSLEICEKSADMSGMAISYGQLGILYFEKEEYREALISSVKAFLLFSQMGAPGAQLAQKNIRKLEKKLPKEEFNAILKEYNITPADEAGKEKKPAAKGKRKKEPQE